MRKLIVHERGFTHGGWTLPCSVVGLRYTRAG